MSAQDFFPQKLSLKSLREAAAGCRACDLYKSATQVVFGEGPARARLLLVGEQPGDTEDKQGHPFVGPAGRVLQRALEEAGIDARDVYLTNAVKHFKFVERGNRRVHVKPKMFELHACLPWLEAEIAVVKPRLVVAMGAIAAQGLLGRRFHLTAGRGRVIAGGLTAPILATAHPSSILRAPDDERRHEQMQQLVEDLRAARAATA